MYHLLHMKRNIFIHMIETHQMKTIHFKYQEEREEIENDILQT
jgi:hypothetical protein